MNRLNFLLDLQLCFKPLTAPLAIFWMMEIKNSKISPIMSFFVKFYDKVFLCMYELVERR